MSFLTAEIKKEDWVKWSIRIPYGLLVWAIVINFQGVFYNLTNPIDDMHGFRQTQTAISTYYFIKEDFSLNYQIPVLGYPWSIPFEFPLYQYIVAIVFKLTHLTLDEAGRAVSIFFYYAVFYPVYGCLRLWGLSCKKIALVLSIVLVSPLYIFWARTFMIESTALFFSFYAFYAAIKYQMNGSRYFLYLSGLLGVVAALTKITTFFVSGWAIGLFVLVYFFQTNEKYHWQSIRKLSLDLCILIFFPIVIAICWTHYADQQKLMNPMADYLTSTSLNEWNFGSLRQKLQSATWEKIYIHFSSAFGGLSASLAIGLALMALTSKKYRLISVILLVSCLVGPVFFTNLYFVHKYYPVASAIYFVLIVGLGIVVLYEQPSFRWASYCLTVFIFLIMQQTFITHYRPLIEASELRDQSLYFKIQQYIPENDSILIFGSDWSSIIPYYSQRKAIMRASWTTERAFEKAIQSTEKKSLISGMVICGGLQNNSDLIDNYALRFSLKRKPVYNKNGCSLWAKGEIHNSKNNSMIRENKMLFLLAESSNNQTTAVIGGGLLAQAPTNMRIVLNKIKQLKIDYGVWKGAAVKMKGVCFELSINNQNNTEKLMQDCITPAYTNDKITRHFSFLFDAPFNGRLILKTYCISSCDYGWAFWDNFKLLKVDR
jgi:hypothetical protein